MCCFYPPANFTKTLSYIVSLEKKEEEKKKEKKIDFLLLFLVYIFFLLIILDILVVLFDSFFIIPANFTKTLPYIVSLKIACNNQ